MEHKFEVVEEPVSCTRCGKKTTVIFTGCLCSVCAGVFTNEERRRLVVKMRRDFVDDWRK